MALVRLVSKSSILLEAFFKWRWVLARIPPNLWNSDLTDPNTLLMSSALFWMLSVLKPTDKEFKRADRVTWTSH